MPEKQQNTKCQEPVETYARVVGFFRPVQHWNKGKQQEFADRKTFDVDNPET